MEGPEIHGSRRIVKELSCRPRPPGDGGKGEMGEKVRRNDASLFRCLTVKDIFKSSYEKIEKICKTHSIQKGKGRVRPEGERRTAGRYRVTRIVGVDGQ